MLTVITFEGPLSCLEVSEASALPLDLRRMPTSLLPRVRVFDPCWGATEWDSIVRFLLGETFRESPTELLAGLQEFTGQHAVPTASGRDAISACIKFLGMEAGDEVIVPSLACQAVARPFLSAGITPVAADIDASLCLDPESVSDCIGSRTRAVLMVHFFGRLCRVKEMKDLAEERDILLIDDAASAFGAKLSGRPASTFGDAGIVSFNYAKIVSSLGGGALILDGTANGIPPPMAEQDPMGVRGKVLQLMGRNFRGLGMLHMLAMGRRLVLPVRRHRVVAQVHLEPNAARTIAGIQARVAQIQIERLERMIEARRRNHETIRQRLEGLEGIELPPQASPWDVHHFLPLMVTKGHRYDLGAFLAKHGYESTWEYHPLHLQSLGVRVRCSLDRTEDVWRRIVLLPVHPNVSQEEAEEMADLVGVWAASQS